MSHRQKNKHKSRHRIHANNGPRIAQKGRVVVGPVASALVITAPTHIDSPVVDTVSTATA